MRQERGLNELYGEDAERADRVVFGRTAAPGRRGFLQGAGLAALGAALGYAIPFSRSMPAGYLPVALAQGQKLAFPGKDGGLVVLGDRPLVAETPAHLLDDDVTPTARHFIRKNGQTLEAAANPDAWELTVDGEVNKPTKIRLGELRQRYAAVGQPMVLECGGNGRAQFQP